MLNELEGLCVVWRKNHKLVAVESGGKGAGGKKSCSSSGANNKL